jgi:hypothetical protein
MPEGTRFVSDVCARRAPFATERAASRGRSAAALGPGAWVHLALCTPRIAPDDWEMAEDSEMDKEHVLVADVMTVKPIVVSLDATLEEADVIIRSTYVTGLPVVDRHGVLVGVIGDAHLASHRFADGRARRNRAP